ncbi:TolC family protein [Candidatus Magnetomoraceae bacterium gMMP-1]
MKIKLIFRAYLFILFIFIFSGCTSSKNYTYNSIKEEYADFICKINKFEQTGVKEGAKEKSCVLTEPISLKDAIKITIENNPDNNMAASRITQAEAVIEQANAVFWPNLKFYTEYLKGDAPSAFLFKTIDQRQFKSGTDFNDPGQIDNYESGIQARLNIYNGGIDILRKNMSLLSFEISKLDKLSLENSLVFLVIQTYYNCLASKEYIKIAEESISTVEEQLRVMNIKFKAGGALKSDILSLKVRLAQAREELVKRNNQLKTAKSVLASIMGVCPDKKIVLLRKADMNLDVSQDFTAVLSKALMHRPELKKVRKQLEKSKMAFDLTDAEYLPKLDIYGKYYYDDPDMDYAKDRENWTLAVLLNWELFSGFSTQAKKKKADAAIKELLAADRKTLLNIKLDVKTACLKFKEAKARLEVAKSSVDMAKESLKLVKKQFDGGSVSITRYLEAELDRNSARIRAAAAFYDREKAIADIGRAAGLLLR